MKPSNFLHLNVHSCHSFCDGFTPIKDLVDEAIRSNMPGIAITDNGDLSGVMEFTEYVNSINNKRLQKGKKAFKPIIGCELYVAPGAKEDKKLSKHCKGYRLTVLAKNHTGYKNLTKIVSNAKSEGFFIRPRTDHADLEKYHEGLIVLSGGIGSEVSSNIMGNDHTALDRTIKWYQQIFADDYYIELQRNVDCATLNDVTNKSMLEQQRVNTVLIQKAQEHGVKVVATNDVYYTRPDDVIAYNNQLCSVLGKTLDELEKEIPVQTRWLRSKKDMDELFKDIPEAIANTMDIFNKVDLF